MATVRDIYEAGRKAQDIDITRSDDWDIDGISPNRLADNQAAWTVFELGRSGMPLAWVWGWRYGSLPASGQSYNYREQMSERGVSLMGLTPESCDEAGIDLDNVYAGGGYEAFNGRDRKIVWVRGLFVGYGSDGEPLVILAREA